MTTSPPQRHGPDWWAYAACDGMDPELWFPLNTVPHDGFSRGRLQLALSTCNDYCPVRDACLIHAVTTGQRYGIWGGLTEGQRASSRECRRIRQAAQAS